MRLYSPRNDVSEQAFSGYETLGSKKTSKSHINFKKDLKLLSKNLPTLFYVGGRLNKDLGSYQLLLAIFQCQSVPPLLYFKIG
jgi:hypothetical protein